MTRPLVVEFAEELRLACTPPHHNGRVTMGFDGRRTAQLGIYTAVFYVREATPLTKFCMPSAPRAVPYFQNRISHVV